MGGVALLSFMIIHLYQFRFGNTEPYLLRPPRYLINFEGILTLSLFWTWDTTIQPVPVRDIYRLEFELFKNMYWVMFYMGAISVFCTHMCLGWQKVVGAPSMDIPQLPIEGDPHRLR